VTTSYHPSSALSLLSLLASISRELDERGEAIGALEARLEDLVTRTDADPDEVRSRMAELAIHRREVRACHRELERLGCSVVGTEPLTIRIPTRTGKRRRSLVWQPQTGERIREKPAFPEH
jgi:hypothetical protein